MSGGRRPEVAQLPPPAPVVPRGASYVYFVRRPDNGAIKIGRTVEIRGRLNDLRVSSDVELDVLLVFRTSVGVERAIHRAFAGCRKRGEWFHPGPQLLAWIERQAQLVGPV